MSEENVSLPVARALASALEKIEEYVPTDYVDLSEPDIDAEHLNHSEQGIMRVTNLLNAAVDVIQGQQEQIEEAEKKISNTETKLGTGALPSGMTDVISGLTTLNSNIPNLYAPKPFPIENTGADHYKTIQNIWNKLPDSKPFICNARDSNNFVIVGFVYSNYKYGAVLYLAFNTSGIVKCTNGAFSNIAL